MAAGGYGYVHSCMISDNFPARPSAVQRTREIVLLAVDANGRTWAVLRYGNQLSVTGADGVNKAQGREEPPAQQAAPHRGGGPIQHAERSLPVSPREKRQ